MAIEWVIIERDSASDDEVLIQEIMSPEGSKVSEGQEICELEGEKSVYSLSAPADGTVFWFYSSGDRLMIGQIVGAICTNGEEKPDLPDFENSKDLKGTENPDASRFSQKALAKLSSLSLDPSTFLPGNSFVTLEDVLDKLSSQEKNQSAIEMPIKVAFLGGGIGALVGLGISGQNPKTRVVGVYDDKSNRLETQGIPLLGPLDEAVIEEHFVQGRFDSVAITITSSMGMRKRLSNLAERIGVPLHSLVHSSVYLPPTAVIDEGAFVLDHARIGPYAHVGRNVFISAFCNVEHHCEIGENSTFGPNVALSGDVRIGPNCVFGTVIGVEPRVTIGANSVVGSGAIVTKNLPEGTRLKVESTTRIR